MTSTSPLEFRCPGCGDRFEVDLPLRTALLDSGCASCGSPVTAGAFVRA